MKTGTVLTPEGATVVSAKRATYWTPLMGSASVSTELSDTAASPERRATQLQPSVTHRLKETAFPKREIW